MNKNICDEMVHDTVRVFGSILSIAIVIGHLNGAHCLKSSALGHGRWARCSWVTMYRIGGLVEARHHPMHNSYVFSPQYTCVTDFFLEIW